MYQKLILHKPKSDPNQGDIIIDFTDVQAHTTAKITNSIGKNFRRSIEQGKPGRIYFPALNNDQPERENVASGVNMQDPELKKFIEECQKQGKRVFIKVPDTPLPLHLGKDTKEFIESKKGKRLFRWLKKKDN